jgi:hypothetical protein
MQIARNLGLPALTALAASLVLAGCGMPGAPLPPSLNLPDPVNNLTAVRAGGEVKLAWTNPSKNTDKLLLKGPIAVRICRSKAPAASCAAIATLELAPRSEGAFTDTLPPPLATGAPRPLTYFVELDNRKGRAAGLSNGAQVLAGQAPAAIAGLAAELRRDGIELHWTPGSPDAAPTPVRLVRTLVTPADKKPKEGLLTPPAEPGERNLLVENTRASHALDADVRMGSSYEYRAQRVARVSVAGKLLELDGPLTAPVRIDAVNVFPPATPKDLAAVATTLENGASPVIDLNWQPGAEADLAGYIVYRRSGDGPWQRISPAQPVVGPSFRDAKVEPGHSYNYAVSAIDQDGHESPRSQETEEAVPGP